MSLRRDASATACGSKVEKIANRRFETCERRLDSGRCRVYTSSAGEIGL
jgi:hypothetical protein